MKRLTNSACSRREMIDMRIDTKQITTGTIVRTLCLVLALANQVMTVCGKTPLPITDAQVADAVALIATIGASLWAWWKNNSFTEHAIAGDHFKDMNKYEAALDKFIDENLDEDPEEDEEEDEEDEVVE